MTQEDKQFLKEFFAGAGIVIAVLFTLFIVVYLSNQNFKLTKPTKPEVVDTYEGCDIVRWSNGQMAEYKYFLHCNNTRPVYGK